MRIRLERYYIWMAIFMVLFTILTFVGREVEGPKESPPKIDAQKAMQQRLSKDKNAAEKLMKEKPGLFLLVGLATLLGMAVFFIGIIILITYFINLGQGRGGLDTVMPQEEAVWGLLDVARLIILFLFFGYVLVILESSVFRAGDIKPDRNFIAILNTTVMDLFMLLCVVHFVASKYKQKLSAIGLTAKKVFKGILTGIASYMALVPLMLFTVLAVLIIANLLKYRPPTEPLVQMLFEEKRSQFLVYLTFFVAIGGPIIEEIFFRGFMLKALKRNMSARWAIIVSAAVFSAVHTNIVGFFPIMVLGICLAYLYEKTGSLIPSITVHVIHNCVVLSFIFILKEMMA